MLLKIGAATIIESLVLAAGVAAAVSFRDNAPEPTVLSTETHTTAENFLQKRKTNLGQKLEIADEPDNDETGGESKVIEDNTTEEDSKSGRGDQRSAKNTMSESRTEPVP